jgi:hypothetical protein
MLHLEKPQYVKNSQDGRDTTATIRDGNSGYIVITRLNNGLNWLHVEMWQRMDGWSQVSFNLSESDKRYEQYLNIWQNRPNRTPILYNETRSLTKMQMILEIEDYLTLRDGRKVSLTNRIKALPKGEISTLHRLYFYVFDANKTGNSEEAFDFQRIIFERYGK